MLRKITAWLPIVLAAVCLQAGDSAVQSLVQFRFAAPETTEKAWVSRDNSPPAVPGRGGGTTFRCPLRKRDRVYWDQTVSLDLSRFTSFEMDLACPHPEALRSLGIYFKSGKGWYVWNKPPAYAGRQTVLMPRNLFSVEGSPAGWHKIEAIRFSPWKGNPENTEITVYSLAGRKDRILIMPGSETEPAEKAASRRAAQRLSDWLAGLNIPHGHLSGDAIPAETRLLILPYNPALSAGQRKSVASFLQRGGKLMVFYSADPELARLMDVRLGAYAAAKNRGQWSAFAFRNPNEWLVPARVPQQSWNIRPVTPLAGRGEIIAEWLDAEGRPTGDPAWVSTGRGLWMTHILLGDNPQQKQAMLLGLLGRLEPEVWGRTAWMMLQRAGQIDSFRSLEEAAAEITREAGKNRKIKQVEPLLEETMQHYRDALTLYEKNAFPAVTVACGRMRESLTRAYSCAQAPVRKEFRGVWDQYAAGFHEKDWAGKCRLLAESGIRAVFPNVAKGGITSCRSAVLPMEAKNGDDPFREYIAAAREAGLEVHAWIICWSLDTAPADFAEQMKKEGRLVIGADGKTRPWLNPAHEANRNMLAAFIREVIRSYNPEGIHLDYIRYPDSDGSYDPVSRRQFEKQTGTAVAQWPRDVLAGGLLRRAWLTWRAADLTALVARLHDEVRAENPRVRLSAAVYGNWPDCADSIGQDWGRWLKDGRLDFVCPMNYTSKPGAFDSLLGKQMRLPGAQKRLYPGIGVSATESQLTPDLVIEQIVTARGREAPGFMLYQLDEVLTEDVLPVLRLGVTRPR
ncbi:MAG TPA: family 10 glycosylhydrolase [Kiritimatiellia bacterium]|nr:family 10 glycosylhydrolase [Kiritimatiellia bacterium]